MASGGYPPTISEYKSKAENGIPLDSLNLKKLDVSTTVDHRLVTRTPSPTPSEAKELARSGVFDWKELASWRFWFRREWLWYYVAIIVVCVIFGLMTLYHAEIVDWLKPAAEWLHDLQVGWLVPIGILFVISFPPLFGHEIVAVLCGLIWGLGIGFGIVSAGTLLGEIGNFYAFKYCCRARGEKLERDSIQYGCLAKVIRDGGFWIALIARLSAIPGHFTTAVFATCGMGIIVFTLAAIFSMPKQFITVYLGVILDRSRSGEEQSTVSKVISNVVLALTAVITLVAMWYIYHRMNKVKVDVIHMRRKRRQGKLQRASTVNSQSPYGYGTSENPFASQSTVQFESQTNIPLTYPMKSQYNGDIKGQPLHAPQPQTYNSANFKPAQLQSYDDRSDDVHSGSSIGHDMNTSKPFNPPDSYAQASYVPPGRTSTSSSRQPIARNATYYTHSSPPPELPTPPKFISGSHNFSRARSPQTTSSYHPISYPTIIPVEESTLPYAKAPSPPPDSSDQPNQSRYPDFSAEHLRETTDASYVTAREPSSHEPPARHRHHQTESSEGPRYPGHF